MSHATPICRTAASSLLVLSLVAGAAAAGPARLAGGAAQRELEIAQLRARLYERVEYPLRLRRLESEIKLAEAEVASLARREAEYRQFTKFKYSNPLLVSVERTRLGLLEARLRLEDLEYERRLLRCHHSEERRLNQLMIQQAREKALRPGR